jgi:hypothetical protein
MFDQYRVKIGQSLPKFVFAFLPDSVEAWLLAPPVTPKPMSPSAWLLIASIVLTAMFISPNGGLALLIVMPINVIILIAARLAARHEARVEAGHVTRGYVPTTPVAAGQPKRWF